MKAGLKSGVGDMTWKVGRWEKHKGKLDMCHSGFHASVRAIDAMQHINCEILALVEVRGEHLEQDDKQCWSEMRVVRAYEWTKPDSVALAIYCAELVVGIYEKQHPDDKRPRQAIEAAKAWLNDPTEENRQAAAAYAAYAAAYAASIAYAAYDAAHYAASAACAFVHAAAYYAASAASAAYDAASAAAYAAAYDAYSSAYAAYVAATLDDIEKWIQARIGTLMEVRP
jgi:hypothetical protein